MIRMLRMSSSGIGLTGKQSGQHKKVGNMSRIWKCMWKWMVRTIYFVLRMLYRILGRELTDETFEAFLQFVKFGIVGVSNTVISYLIYIVSLSGMKKGGLFAGTDYIIAQLVSFVLSVLWSFYWNDRAVFVLKEGERRSVWKALLKTYVSYSFTGLFLNTLLLWIWVDLLHISQYAAPLINLLVSVPVNFMINKCWAFKGS